MKEFELRINGDLKVVKVDPGMPLLWVLRDVLGMGGTKYGCGIGQCGCCTAHLNGIAIRTCQTPVAAVGTGSVTTIEGLSACGEDLVQFAWREENTAQCGYCQAGQIMSASALLAGNRNPSDGEIDAAMSGNLCRCGTYKRIRKSIKRAAKLMQEKEGAS